MPDRPFCWRRGLTIPTVRQQRLEQMNPGRFWPTLRSSKPPRHIFPSCAPTPFPAGRIGGQYQKKRPIFPPHLSKPTQGKREDLAQPFNLIRAKNPPAGRPLVSTIRLGLPQQSWIAPIFACSHKWRRWNVSRPNLNRLVLSQRTAHGWWTSDGALTVGLNLRCVTIVRETRFALNTFR